MIHSHELLAMYVSVGYLEGKKHRICEAELDSSEFRKFYFGLRVEVFGKQVRPNSGETTGAWGDVERNAAQATFPFLRRSSTTGS